ncbi:TonB-dependent siderophore receptor [Undibacterium sp.]|jgi:iron complex outermembrane receptor protein|uniref:TonB-dependent siderophore receptor n=1 Tax=Undibacterium sp. TaxID=1914977 RepID=UPI002B806800|nr:TonB-dependent siderophore receptor [Undibacterium sp.]HTD05024.1 TonB-dependent siderophore receptor [Undibacterium sp.]
MSNLSSSRVRLSIIGLSIAQAFSVSAFAQTALPDVIISAVKQDSTKADRASVGGFSDAPILETPASVTVFTQGLMRDLQVRLTTDAMKFDASVNDSYNAIGYSEQFSIRGFDLDNSSSYRKDGLAIPADASIPLENKERIEILKGIAGFQAGFATPGGVINYVTKRPTDTPLRSVTVGASERGTLYGAVDLGGRFDDTRFGYRINAADERLRSYVKGADGERQFASFAFDWKISPQALLQLDMDYQHKSQLSVPGFQLFNGTDLPRNVSADTMLNNQPWARPVDTRDSNLGLRFEYKFNQDWQASLSANKHEFKRNDYTAFPYGCSSAGLFPGYCANGDYDVYDYQSTGETKSPLATQALLQGTFLTGTLQHALTVGFSSFERRDSFGDCVYGKVDCLGTEPNGTSNIYVPVVVSPSTIVTGPVSLRRSENEWSVFAQDILSLTDELKLHVGARHVHIKRDQFMPDATYDRSYLLPNIALVYSPQKNWAVYGSFTEGLEHGGIAPLGTNNVNALLNPNKSKQYELGAKADLSRDLSVTAAVFQIKKSLEYIDANNDYVSNGQAEHTGLELSAQGRLTGNLSLGTSLTALRARQYGTGDATLDGKRVTNVPSLKASVYTDYAVQQVAGLKVNATLLYSGDKAFSPDNRVTVPGYSVVNLGARYATHFAGTATTLRFNVDNVFDKFYWRDVTQSLGGYLFPGASRLYKVSAQFDF